jgi:hypothetical protein
MLRQKRRRPLQQKLKQDSNHNQGRNDLLQPKDAAYQRDAGKRQK